jgi:transposase
VSREGFPVREVTVVAPCADGVVVGAGHGRVQIARVTFTSADRVREVINNFNEDGFDSLSSKYAGGRPPTFALAQRQQINKIAPVSTARSRPPVSTWSLHVRPGRLG